jgi:pullulanase
MNLVAKELHAIDPSILVYGEPWAGGPAGIEVNSKGTQRRKGWAVFSDEMRNALRGEVFEIDDTGFLNAGTDIPATKGGIRAGLDSFADSPLETINYVECHDNHTLQDRLQITDTKRKITGSEEAYDRMSRLAVLTLMTSQGIPFIHSGQEFGRSKSGEDNTYNLGDQINNIRWSDKEKHRRRNRFYRNAIALRKAHPMFRLGTREEIDRALDFLDDQLGLALPEGTIAYRLTDPTGEDSWTEAIVALNGSGQTRVIPLPPPASGHDWVVASIDGTFDGRLAGGQMRARDAIDLAPHSGAVLCRLRG